MRGPEESGEPRVPRASAEDRGRALREIGGSLRFGLLPVERPVSGREEWKKEPALPAGIPVLDLRDCAPEVDLAQPDDPAHFSAEGNRLVGACLATVLRTP